MNIKSSTSFYDRMAEHYDRLTSEHAYSLGDEIHAAVTAFEGRANRSVLDIGIGTGLLSARLATLGYEISGLDGSQEMLRLCAAKHFAKRLICFAISDGSIPPLGQTFDFVICAGMLEFVRDKRRFLESVYGLLDEGGIFVVAVRDPELNPQFSTVDHGGAPVDAAALINPGMVVFHHTWTDVKAILLDLGFEVVAVKDVLAYSSPSQVADIMNRLVTCRRMPTSPAASLNASLDKTLREWGFSAKDVDSVAIPLVLEGSTVARLERDVDVLSRLVTRLMRLNTLKRHRKAHQFTLGAEKIRSLRETPFIARPDFILCDGKMKLIELNVDSSLGGLVQIAKLVNVLRNSPMIGADFYYRSPIEGLEHYLMGLLDGKVSTCAILSSRSFSEYYKGITFELATALRNAGLQCSCCYADELDFGDYVTFNDAPIGLLFRMDAILGYSDDTLRLKQCLAQAAKTHTAVVADSRFLAIEHKAVLADLWHLASVGSNVLTDEEADLIREMVVPTFYLTQLRPRGKETRHQYLLRHKDKHVVKRMFSFGGSHTYVGLYLSNAEWEAATMNALREPSMWVVQDYIDPDRAIRHADRFVMHRGSEGKRCIISPFVFQSTIAGFLCRTHLDEAEGVLGLGATASMGLMLVGEKTTTSAE